MRIWTQYHFDIPKSFPREEILPAILHFLDDHALKYQDFLFELHTRETTNRLTYFEKLTKKDPFWAPYFSKYPSIKQYDGSFIDAIGISNLIKSSWDSRITATETETSILLQKVQEQFCNLPKSYNFRMAFCGIPWFGAWVLSPPLTQKGISRLIPLSPCITLWKDYPEKTKLTFRFEQNSAKQEPLRYVDDFSRRIGASYTKEILFVVEEETPEQKELSQQIDSLLCAFWNLPIEKPKSLVATSPLHPAKILRSVFTGWSVATDTNGGYAVKKRDSFGNQMEFYFDLDRESRLLCGRFFYRGMGITHSAPLQESFVADDDAVLFYVQAVWKLTEAFEAELAPRIAASYPPVPDWFHWE